MKKFAVCLFFALIASAVVVFAEGEWQMFENGDGTLTINGYIGSEEHITVPATINGMPVSDIAPATLLEASKTAVSFAIEPGLTFLSEEAGVLYWAPYEDVPEQKVVFAYPKASPNEEYYVPDYVRDFEWDVCAGAVSLKRLSLPTRLVSISDRAFSDCAALEEIVFRGDFCLPFGEYVDEEGYFRDEATDAYIPGGLYIGENAFSGCTALRQLVLPEGVSGLGFGAFSGCTSLRTAVLPETLENLGDNPGTSRIFYDCPNLTVYGVSGSAAEGFCSLSALPFIGADSWAEAKAAADEALDDIPSGGDVVSGDTPSEWAIPEVNAARVNGLIPSELDSAYTQPITRREFCLLVSAYCDKLGIAEGTAAVSFTDTSDPAVLKAASLGVINGYPDGTFAPDRSITRSEAAAMLSRTAALSGDSPNAPYAGFDDQDLFGWAQENIEFISCCIDINGAKAVMGGVGNNLFDPAGNYTREQAILTFQRLYRFAEAVNRPLYPGETPVELAHDVWVAFDGKTLNFTNITAEGDHTVYITVPGNLNFTGVLKSDVVTPVNGEISYDISDMESGHYKVELRQSGELTASAPLTRPSRPGIFSAPPQFPPTTIVDIYKDNDHGYLMPYPSYEYNKTMFDEHTPPAPGEYLEPTLYAQSDDPDIAALAASITAGLTSDYDKASAVYDWLGENIAYDYETYNAQADRPQDAISVLSQRSAVCEGYSQLASALLRSVGVPTRCVHGSPVVNYGLGQTDDDWIYILMNGGNEETGEYLPAWHAWNEVWVGDRWIIMDATWGRVQDTENWDDFYTQRDYFDPSLWKFSYSHIILGYEDEIPRYQ